MFILNKIFHRPFFESEKKCFSIAQLDTGISYFVNFVFTHLGCLIKLDIKSKFVN